MHELGTKLTFRKEGAGGNYGIEWRKSSYVLFYPMLTNVFIKNQLTNSKKKTRIPRPQKQKNTVKKTATNDDHHQGGW